MNHLFTHLPHQTIDDWTLDEILFWAKTDVKCDDATMAILQEEVDGPSLMTATLQDFLQSNIALEEAEKLVTCRDHVMAYYSRKNQITPTDEKSNFNNMDVPSVLVSTPTSSSVDE